MNNEKQQDSEREITFKDETLWLANVTVFKILDLRFLLPSFAS